MRDRETRLRALYKKGVLALQEIEKGILAMFFRFFTALSAISMALVLTASAAFSFEEPAPGSPERAGILDAVRPSVEAALRGPVEFVVTSMRKDGDWAFAILEPQRPDGAKIDVLQTGYAEDADFMDGLTTYALTQYKYDRWNLIAIVVGPTDAAFDPWPRIFGVPRALLGM